MSSKETPRVQINRISNSEYSFKLSNKVGIRFVCKALTFTDPNIYAYNRKIEKFDKRKLTFKRGMLNDVQEYLNERQVDYSVTDYDFDLPDGVDIDDRMTGKYIHQRRAVEKFYKKRFGIIQVPTRGGKTFIMSEILRIFLDNFKGNFLFCVDSTDLFTQAVGDIHTFFERYGGVEVGEIRSGNIDLSKRVTVAMMQTLQSVFSAKNKDRKKRIEVEKYLKNLAFLSVDEIHDNFSKSRFKIYKRCHRIEFLLLLSATPYKGGEVVQNLRLKEWSGDVIYKITEKSLRKRKVLSDYKVFELVVDHNDIDYDIDSEDYSELREKLIFNSDFRNGVLIKTIGIMQKLGVKTLVLFQSIDHGSIVSQLTDLPFISGRDKNKIREQRKKEFLEADGGVLLASNIFKKGITLPAAEVLINVDDGVQDANTIQKKGRVLGVTETKERSAIIDFIDLYDAYFSEHSDSRLDVYVDAIGEDNIGILDTSSDDWAETLERWIKKWLKV